MVRKAGRGRELDMDGHDGHDLGAGLVPARFGWGKGVGAALVAAPTGLCRGG